MKTFLILLAIMFALRYLMPYLIRFALKVFVQKQMRKAQQYAYQAQQQQRQGQPRPQEPRFQNNTRQTPPNGNVKVEYVPEEVRQRKDFPGGEYVEYEEVK